jgi:hypothetical protein
VDILVLDRHYARGCHFFGLGVAVFGGKISSWAGSAGKRARQRARFCHNSFPARPSIPVVLLHLAVTRFTQDQVLNRIGIGSIVGGVSVLAGLAVGHHTEVGNRTIGENGFNRIFSVGLPESFRRRMGSAIEP